MKRVLQTASIFAIALAVSAVASSQAQQVPKAPKEAVEIRLYTLDCGLTEFKDADVFSDTGDYRGKSLVLPTPLLPDPSWLGLDAVGHRKR